MTNAGLPERLSLQAAMGTLRSSVQKGVPMIYVPDVARALEWYTSIGFEEIARFDDDGLVNFGMVALGRAELMLNIEETAGPRNVSLWFYTDRVDELYQLLKARGRGGAPAPTGPTGDEPVLEFAQDIEDMFYGARQFGICDPHGYVLYFIQSIQK